MELVEKKNQANINKALSFLSNHTLEKMETLASGIVLKRINVKADFGKGCYTKCDSNPIEIVLGAGFFQDKEELTARQIRDSYTGLYMHELGHAIFTDLDSIKGLKDEDRKFLFPFVNILEDHVVERAVGYIYNVKHLFTKLTNLVFGYVPEYVEEMSHQGLLCGIQALYRCDEKTARKNKIVNDHWDYIGSNYYRILDILDPTERFNEQVEFGRKMLEFLKEEGIDPVQDYKDFQEELRKYLEEALDSLMKSSGSGEQSKSMKGDSSDSESSESTSGEKDIDKDNSEMSQALRSLKQDLESSLSEETDEQVKDLIEHPERPWTQIIAEQDSGVEVLGVNRNSKYRDIKNYIDAKFNLSGVIRQVEESIKKCGIDYRETIPGQFQGHFNIREAMRPGNLRHFERVLDQSTDPGNLCFDLVLDVSGSMTGSCARVSALCMIALAEALEHTHVDYRVHIYSSSYMMVKDIRESIRVIEPLMEKVLSSKYYDKWKGMELWCGNNESLMMTKLKENSVNIHKDKVLIHIGDGGFYFRDRNYISDTMEKYGYITTLGVGLFCDEMSKYHKNSITVMNDEELDKLPKAILDYVASMFR